MNINRRQFVIGAGAGCATFTLPSLSLAAHPLTGNLLAAHMERASSAPSYPQHTPLLNGKPFEWTNFKGKHTLLNLWAPWCGPCLGELPAFDDLKAKHANRNFDIVTCLTATPNADQTAIDRMWHRLGLRHLASLLDGSPDRREMSRLYAAIGQNPNGSTRIAMPVTLLLDRDGAPMARLVGDRRAEDKNGNKGPTIWASDHAHKFCQYFANLSGRFEVQ